MTGLTKSEVEQRISEGKVNTQVNSDSNPVWTIIRRNVFTFFNVIFAILAVLLIWVGAYRELVFLPVIIVNTLIGIVQEIRSRKALNQISLLNAPKAKVIRDSAETEISSEETVVDDIAIFSAGGQIYADASVIEGEVLVNESLLTGESDEVPKTAGDSLMSGSFVVSGQCVAKLEKVGADSYASKLTLQAKSRNKGTRSEIMRSLNRLLIVMGIIIVPLAIALFYVDNTVIGNGIEKSVVGMVAAVVGMIPEGLFLLTSVALAIGVMRLARSGVLSHEISSIETLARVDVLCLDKTGTITENNMTVQEDIPLDGYSGEEGGLTDLIANVIAPFGADNITMKALKEHYRTNRPPRAEAVFSFNPAFKYSGVKISGTSYVIGAPEILLREDYAAIDDKIAPFAEKGFRALLIGTYDGELDGKALSGKVTPVAAVFLVNPVRAGAEKTFSYFYNQGVDIKVISGDNPVTVSNIARQAGIQNADKFVDARTLNDSDIANAVKTYSVFGRVTPAQKSLLVKALQKDGHTVAMTGDGVNDVPALKLADCSIAMASGSEAAAHASQLVLLGSDFSCMPRVVGEGRRVINNIQRSASLFLVKNIFSFLMSLFAIIAGFTYPIAPSQLSLVSLFTIGVPAFFLALEPDEDILKGKFLSNIITKALPAGIVNFIMVCIFNIIGLELKLDQGNISTSSTYILVVVGFLFLLRVCSPFSRMRIVLYVSMVAGFIISAAGFSFIFGISKIPISSVMIVVLAGMSAQLMLNILDTRNIRALNQWMRDNQRKSYAEIWKGVRK